MNAKLISILSDYEKHILRETTPPEKNIFSNPENTAVTEQVEQFKTLENVFQDLHYWLEDDQMELDAMNQTINVFYEMVAEHDKLLKKRDDLEKDIKNAQFGEKGLKSLFTFKSKEEIIKDLEEQKKKVEEEIKVLIEVIKVACFGLEWNMDDFKKEKMSNYFNYLKLYFLVYMKNTKTEENIWTNICSNENIQAALLENK
ncbi:MAG: hypothetical protein MJ252_14220 [archaeon]|nr:hypothetical protein [archaeon]